MASSTGFAKKLNGHGAWVTTVTWSPDGKQLASGSEDRTVRVWDVQSGRVAQGMDGFNGSVSHIAWSPNGQWLVTANAAPKWDVDIFDTTSWQRVASIRSNLGLPYLTSVGGLDWSPDSKHLLVAANGFSGNNTPTSAWANIYETQMWRRVDSLENGDSGVGGAVWSPDGKSIAFGSVHYPVKGLERQFVIWQPDTDDIARLSDGVDSVGTGAAWSPDGKMLAGVSDAENIPIWDVATGQKTITLTGHTGSIHSISWSPLGGKLASTSVDMTVRIWDTTTGQNLKAFKHGNPFSVVVWSLDGSMIAAGCDMTAICLWDAK